jgi:hypothetical protein
MCCSCQHHYTNCGAPTNPTSRSARTTWASALHWTALHCTVLLHTMTPRPAACCQHFFTVYWAWTELLSACATGFLDPFSLLRCQSCRMANSDILPLKWETSSVFTFVVTETLPSHSFPESFFLFSKFHFIFMKANFVQSDNFFVLLIIFLFSFYAQQTFRNHPPFFSHVKLLGMSKLFPPLLSASAKCRSMASNFPLTCANCSSVLGSFLSKRMSSSSSLSWAQIRNSYK